MGPVPEGCDRNVTARVRSELNHHKNTQYSEIKKNISLSYMVKGRVLKAQLGLVS